LKSSDPKITVYIACHNYGQYLREAIESVLDQTLSDWELLIIDDNSSDNTPEIVKSYSDHPKIEAFTTIGIGLPAVCNLALENASGEYIMRLDGDDILDENALRLLSDQLDRSPEMGLVFPDYFLVDEEGEIFSQHHRQRNYGGDQKLDLPPNGACTLIRKTVLQQCGGYRTDLGAQDGFDLWAKVRNNHKMGNINLPLFKYRRHSANLTNNTPRIMNARRQIKRDAVEEHRQVSGPIIGVIPCRRHFEFVENFWQQKIKSKTLLERTIETCLKSTLIEILVIACDNPKAEDCLNKYDDTRLRFFLRDPKSTARSKNLLGSLEKIALNIDPEMSGITVSVFCQAPFITTETVDETITTLLFNDTDCAFGVERVDSQLLRRTHDGLVPINKRGNVESDYDIIYRDSETCFATKNKNFLNGELKGATIANFEISTPESFFIQSKHHLNLARLISGE
jgi:glycosyltransferase involved in cell wall biosynthesis